MFRLVGFLAGQEGAAGMFAMWNDQASADLGAIAERGDALAVLWQAGVTPHMGVGPVAGSQPGGSHDQACVGVDDDLHVCGHR